MAQNHGRANSIFSLKSRNILKSSMNSESALSRRNDGQKSEKSGPNTLFTFESPSLKSRISKLNQKTISFKSLKSKKGIKKLEKKHRMDELKLKLVNLNSKRKYYRKYLT
jgi:hypothetical protein